MEYYNIKIEINRGKTQVGNLDLTLESENEIEIVETWFKVIKAKWDIQQKEYTRKDVDLLSEGCQPD